MLVPGRSTAVSSSSPIVCVCWVRRAFSPLTRGGGAGNRDGSCGIPDTTPGHSRAICAAAELSALLESVFASADRALTRARAAHAAGADAVALLTDWPQYTTLPFRKIAATMNSPIIFDGRNCLHRDLMRETGFQYYPMGRPAVENSLRLKNRV